MDKPTQSKKPYVANNDDLLSASEEALYHISEAMDYLRGLWERGEIFTILDDAFDKLEEKYNEYEAACAEEDREELENLNREYYRSVL